MQKENVHVMFICYLDVDLTIKRTGRELDPSGHQTIVSSLFSSLLALGQMEFRVSLIETLQYPYIQLMLDEEGCCFFLELRGDHQFPFEL